MKRLISSLTALLALSLNAAAMGPLSSAEEPALKTLSLSSAHPGQEHLSIVLTGEFTSFIDGSTTASFGDGVIVNRVIADSATQATADITVLANADPGPRDVTLTTGTQVVKATGAFAVKRPAVLKIMKPDSLLQRQADVSVSFFAEETSFKEGSTTASFGEGITVKGLTVESPTRFAVQVTVAADAVPGPRDVVVTTGGEVVTALGGFTIKGAPLVTVVRPDSAQPGQSNLSVSLIGEFTNFVHGTTTASFGDGIKVNSLTVESPTRAIANITLPSGVNPGQRAVTLTTGTEVAPASEGLWVASENFTTNYSVLVDGIQVFNTVGGTTDVGYVSAQAGAGAAPAGIAVLSYSVGGAVVAEAGIPATPPILNGRVFARADGATNTGIAFTNPDTTDATISFSFRDIYGAAIPSIPAGSFVLPAGRQLAAFLNQVPFNATSPMEGSFFFTSTLPVAAMAIQSYINESGQFLFSSIPVLPTAADGTVTLTATPGVIPRYSTGGGWATDVILSNPTATAVVGKIRYLRANGAEWFVEPYTVLPQGTRRFTLITGGSQQEPGLGHVQVVPDGTNMVPVVDAIVSYKDLANAVVRSLEGITGMPTSTSFRTYVEKSGVPGAPGSTRSSVAIANPSSSLSSATLQILGFNGQPVGSAFVVSIPPNGQIAGFLDQLMAAAGLPANFSGTLRVISAAPLAVTTSRVRYNSLGTYLTTTMPVFDNNAPPTASLVLFPRIVDGAGYSTQLILLNGSTSITSGQLIYLLQDGSDPGGTLN